MNRIKWAGDGFRKGWNGQSNVMKRLGRAWDEFQNGLELAV